MTDIRKIVLDKISKNQPICLDIGCGPNKQEGYIGIDLIDYPCVDIPGDYRKILANIPSNSVDSVYSCHFIEHIEDPGNFIAEIFRVLKIGGKIKVIAPHFSNPYYYSDYSHRTFWGLYSFSYFTEYKYFRRTVPNYDISYNLKIKEVFIRFGSCKPFYFRHAIKKAFQALFNMNLYMKELYEDFFTYLVPAYEVEYNLIKIK